MRKMSIALAAISVPLCGASAYAAKCNLDVALAVQDDIECAKARMDRNLKLNDLVMVGTHNSYKTDMPDAVRGLLRETAPDWAKEVDYRHRPLAEQLDAGIRQLEIDVYYDPEGGRFADPLVLQKAGVDLSPVHRAAMEEPGFKVLHVQDADIYTSCATLSACLWTIRRWSVANPDHAPILIMVNTKSGPSPVPNGVMALPFDTAAFDALDEQVRAVFPAPSLITPDNVQAGYDTLREAVLTGGWPTLGQARGKLFLALDEGPETVAVYRGERRSLEGRVFFVNTDKNSPAAAYITINDPIADGERIRKAVKEGFIVRTRADSGTIEARSNDVRRRDAAFASGAQFISTDYFWPEPRIGGEYQVRLGNDAAAICNTVRRENCVGISIEDAQVPALKNGSNN